MLRISTATVFQRGLNGLLEQQANLGKTQEHISSGKRIMTPADDPAAANRILELTSAIDTVTQYQENANRAKARLEVEEITIRAVSNAIPRALELTLMGSSGTYTAEQRSSMAVEVRGIRDQILSLANSQDGNGEYLFSGFQGRVRPFSEAGGVYSYNGDMGQRELRISVDRTLPDRDSGFDVFMDVPTSAGGVRNVFETLEQIAATLDADASPAAFVADLDLIVAHMSQIQAGTGGRLKAIDDQNEVNLDFLLTMEVSRSEVEDLDYAEAITLFNKQQIALEAAQKSFLETQSLSLFNFMR